ncbi:methyltransferase domain-containing protein [Gluconacetobacter asukensis]|uniref:Methyltransferase domain-containing protein n=1 Tax=Gluconacetobacter asukensis TaxID=1017181 RepID=A0A7W4J1H0_9PROT|nr:methyltransferase domain-containing protein [Gluconacetobacter asukensis]MBB2172945.1 methyltransferase domain-containing protein [Gluconacetobacter asukensis]
MAQTQRKTPFWDLGYSNRAVSCMGGPSIEVFEVSPALRARARVVELGCGEGRNALYLAQLGHTVFASDISQAAIDKLKHFATDLDVQVVAELKGAQDFVSPPDIDLFVAQTVLHFFETEVWKAILRDAIRNTRDGGIHCLTNFMDEKDYPLPKEIIDCGHLCKFQRGDIEEIYKAEGWEIIRSDHYVKWDSHPGIVMHAHSCEKIVARKPSKDYLLPKIEIGVMDAPNTIPSTDFLGVSLGVSRADVTGKFGDPHTSHGMTIRQRTVAGNNQVGLADSYVLEDLIYGTYGFQFVNGLLTGKYRYFTSPRRVSVVGNA